MKEIVFAKPKRCGFLASTTIYSTKNTHNLLPGVEHKPPPEQE
jgi:hypothetical protein